MTDIPAWCQREALRGREKRLVRIFGRFVPEDALSYTDRELIEAAVKAWRRHLAAEIVDVGE